MYDSMTEFFVRLSFQKVISVVAIVVINSVYNDFTSVFFETYGKSVIPLPLKFRCSNVNVSGQWNVSGWDCFLVKVSRAKVSLSTFSLSCPMEIDSIRIRLLPWPRNQSEDPAEQRFHLTCQWHRVRVRNKPLWPEISGLFASATKLSLSWLI